MKRMMALAGVFLLLSAPAMAQNMTPRGWDGLDDAKVQGLVGERYDGYVAPVREDVPQDMLPSIESINNERLERYEAIAERNRLELQAVQGLAGEKLIEMTPEGQYVMPQEGQWVRKNNNSHP
ncbi:MAG TPA: DUF1318 domain-containing protein [Rhodospirillaceae bacterium]|nr:MAG: hypothetical protein A2018_03560 [Alphaproteobacteria bacterium GWF2_58_20]HAU29645.1 DUF1318 domain-containing protein [Rhodospirillaceae bacterium]